MEEKVEKPRYSGIVLTGPRATGDAYNPFEPPESHEQQISRVAATIRENVDRRMAKENA